MNKHPTFLLLAIILMFSLRVNMLSQIKDKLVIGATLQTSHYQTAFELNAGIQNRKNFSSVDIICIMGIDPWVFNYFGNYEYIAVDPNLFSRAGIGYSYRYYPNKVYSLFSSFFHGNVSYSRVKGTNTLDQRVIDPTSVTRNMYAFDLGYGVSINFSHHYTFLNSVGWGAIFMSGEDHIPALFTKDRPYKGYDSSFQLNFSFLYHFIRF